MVASERWCLRREGGAGTQRAGKQEAAPGLCGIASVEGSQHSAHDLGAVACEAGGPRQPLRYSTAPST
jgi:hypothetical protein